MDRRVADCACLILCRLVMEVRSPRGAAEARGGMALQAKNIEIAGLYQVWIRRAVRDMARHASLGLDRLMLKNKRALLVDVAVEANRIPCSRRA